MQPASRRNDETRKETAQVDRSHASVAHALEERLASGRPMPRSLRRAYEQLMARDREADQQTPTADGGS